MKEVVEGKQQRKPKSLLPDTFFSPAGVVLNPCCNYKVLKNYSVWGLKTSQLI